MILVSQDEIAVASINDLRATLHVIRERIRAEAARQVLEATRAWVTTNGLLEVARLEVTISGHPLMFDNRWVTPFDANGEVLTFSAEASSSFWDMLDQAVGSVSDFDDGSVGAVDFDINVTGAPATDRTE